MTGEVHANVGEANPGFLTGNGFCLGPKDGKLVSCQLADLLQMPVLPV